jgi:hypothetical protein
MWRSPGWIPDDDRNALERAASSGWQVRAATTRWDMVWQAERPMLHALKVVVMPGPDASLQDDEAVALLRARLLAAGLEATEPDPVDLAAALRRCRASLLSGRLVVAGHPRTHGAAGQ